MISYAGGEEMCEIAPGTSIRLTEAPMGNNAKYDTISTQYNASILLHAEFVCSDWYYYMSISNEKIYYGSTELSGDHLGTHESVRISAHTASEQS